MEPGYRIHSFNECSTCKCRLKCFSAALKQGIHNVELTHGFKRRKDCLLSTPLLLTAEFSSLLSLIQMLTLSLGLLFGKTHTLHSKLFTNNDGNNDGEKKNCYHRFGIFKQPTNCTSGHGWVHSKRKATHGEKVVTLRSEMSRKGGGRRSSLERTEPQVRGWRSGSSQLITPSIPLPDPRKREQLDMQWLLQREVWKIRP